MKEVSKRVLNAERAYHNLVNAARILRNMKKIANSPIPKFKQKKFDDLVTTWITKEYNANQAFEAAIRKLRGSEEKVLRERLGLL